MVRQPDLPGFYTQLIEGRYVFGEVALYRENTYFQLGLLSPWRYLLRGASKSASGMDRALIPTMASPRSLDTSARILGSR